ncbi:Glycosyltransferase [Quillaja saponaria]|uniref:Glycosyltransferase n=1 Tax=Quillaja saponaria TaxID=32244 RepID=A0AAD7QDI5_QUISA|nr:Glycosyltransferase [Quillaja saponaria]
MSEVSELSVGERRGIGLEKETWVIVAVKGKHVAVFAFPFATHAAPLLSIIHRIAAVAPDVRFTFFSTSQSNNIFFSGNVKHNKQYVDNVRPYDVPNGLPDNYVASYPIEPVELFLKVAPDTLGVLWIRWWLRPEMRSVH